MNNWLKILLIVNIFSPSILARKSCRTDLIRSFGLHGRLVPDRSNILCPSVELNCCSTHDQMKIHKRWQGHIKADLETHYAT